MAENVGQGFLDDTVNRQIGGLSRLAERWRNGGFDHDLGMRLAPQPQQRTERLAQAEFREADRPQLFENAPIKLLQGIDLFPDGAAVLAQGYDVRLTAFGNPHQRTDVRAKRKKVRPELVMQLPRDLLALDVLQRHYSLSQPSL